MLNANDFQTRRVSGVVFDLDGTLVDSLSTSYEGINYGLTQVGLKPMTPQQLAPFMGPGEAQILKRIAGEELGSLAYSKFRSFILENLNRVVIYEGVIRLLEQLRSSDVPIGIFTGRGRETTDMILEGCNFSSWFRTVVTSDEVKSPKPDAEGLLLSITRMDLQPAQVLFVGDSPADMIAGHAAGTFNVAALWDSRARREALEPHKPHFWADHPLDLSNLFI